MKLNILVVGDCIKLLKDKKVTLINSGQNKAFLEKYELENKNIKSIKKSEKHITIPKNTLLKVDRVYIRKGSGSGYNSLTFVSKGNAGIPDGRFFLPVGIVNELDVEIMALSEMKDSKPVRKQIFERALEIRKEKKKYLDNCRFEAFKEFFDFSKEPLYRCKLRLNLEVILNELNKKDVIKVYEKALEKGSLTPKDMVSMQKFYNYLVSEREAFESSKNYDISSLVAEISLYKIKEDFVIKFNNNLFEDEFMARKAVYIHNYNKFIKFLIIKELLEKDYLKEQRFLENVNYFVKNEIGEEFLKPNSGIIDSEGYKGLIENSSDESEFFLFYDFIKYFSFFNPKYNDSKYISYSDEGSIVFDTKQLRSKLTKAKKNK